MTARDKIVKALVNASAPLTAKQIAKKVRITYQAALRELNDMAGLKKSRLRTGARGPAAAAYRV